MKIDRLIGILSVLLQKEKTTAPELAERFEVSRRTINRDIEDLCKRQESPYIPRREREAVFRELYTLIKIEDSASCIPMGRFIQPMVHGLTNVYLIRMKKQWKSKNILNMEIYSLLLLVKV